MAASLWIAGLDEAQKWSMPRSRWSLMAAGLWDCKLKWDALGDGAWSILGRQSWEGREQTVTMQLGTGRPGAERRLSRAVP